MTVWDASGKKSHTFAGQRGVSTSIAISGDGSLLASGNTDKTIIVWENVAAFPNLKR